VSEDLDFSKESTKWIDRRFLGWYHSDFSHWRSNCC